MSNKTANVASPPTTAAKVYTRTKNKELFPGFTSVFFEEFCKKKHTATRFTYKDICIYFKDNPNFVFPQANEAL